MTADEVIQYYQDGFRESERLTSAGPGRLEFLRTQRIVGQRLRDRPMCIADIGGGPGLYAAWLAGLGHEVELVDPVPIHVQQAQELPVEPGSIRASIGDAREVDLGDESVDAVLLLGPLYHLPSVADRMVALAEAWRILRPGGLVFAAAISRFASLHDGLKHGWLNDPDFASIVGRDLETGHHRNPTNRPGWFTDAYFHRPEELGAEVADAGFHDVSVHGVEGLVGWLANLDELIQDHHQLEAILDALDRVDTEPSLLGASAHLLACGSK